MAKLEQADIAKAAKIVAKFDGEKYSVIYGAIADQLKVGQNTAIQLMYYAEPVADPSLKIKPTPASVKRAVQDGLRWERIAARADISVARAKQLAEEAGLDPSERYTGKGRRPSSGSETATKAAKATNTAKKSTTAKKTVAKKAPTKRKFRSQVAARRP